MIESLQIKNFKSIRDLQIPCKKLNVFIGEPNSGKSNIIEALSLRSQDAFSSKDLNHDIFRYKTIGDLFFDFNFSEPIEIDTGSLTTLLKYAHNPDGSPLNQFEFIFDNTVENERNITIMHNGEFQNRGFMSKTDTHFYEFSKLDRFIPGYLPHLSVPHGANLPVLLLSNSELKKWVSDFLKQKGLHLTLKPTENDLVVSKLVDGEIYSYPYFALSETLQRIIFYKIAIESNKEKVLLFDEPESNTFPMYTKQMAEDIALDETNQFFISTHNPYLLLSLIEKSNLKDINVCITEMEDFETKVHMLDEKQLSEILEQDYDVFFNFNKILGR